MQIYKNSPCFQGAGRGFEKRNAGAVYETVPDCGVMQTLTVRDMVGRRTVEAENKGAY